MVLAEPPVLTLFTGSRPKPGELLRTLLTRPRTGLAIVKFGASGISPAVRAIRGGDMEKALARFGGAVLGRERFRRLSPERLVQARANFISAELVGSGYEPLESGAIRDIDLPVLLINGQRSPRLFHRFTDRLEQLLPRSRRVVISGASHIMHEDNPPEYNSAVLRFLRQAREGAGSRDAHGQSVQNQASHE
jgi:pimeloyl-ACP methyl ester carboxylesterase